jgi:hypothetical protein
MTIKARIEEIKLHRIDVENFTQKNEEVCIYEIGDRVEQLEIVEYAPTIF